MKNVSESQVLGSKLSRHDFALEALVDFPDDAICAPEPVTPAHIDAIMRATSGKAGDIRVWSPTFGNFHSLDPLGEVILE